MTGFTSITLLSERNSLRYFLMSHQFVESGVPKLIMRTPVFPNLTSGVLFYPLVIPVKFN